MFPIQGRKSAVNVQFCCQGRGVWFTAQYHISTSQALFRENQVGIEKFWLLSKCQPHNGSAGLLCAERGAKMSNLRLLHFSPFQQIIQDFHPHPHQDTNLISKTVLAWGSQLMPRYSSSRRDIQIRTESNNCLRLVLQVLDKNTFFFSMPFLFFCICICLFLCWNILPQKCPWHCQSICQWFE